MLTTDINHPSILCVGRRSLQWHQNVFVKYKKVKYGRQKVDFLQFIYGVGQSSHTDSPLLSSQPHSHYDIAAASRVGTVFDSVIQPACLIWRGVPARLSKEVWNKCSFNCVVNVAKQRISLTDILSSDASGVASESCNPGNY